MVTLSVSFSTTITAAFGQEPAFPSQLSLPVTIQPDGTFQSLEDGFKLKVPANWGVQDVDNISPSSKTGENQLGYTYLAIICGDYTPGLGGTSECQITPNLVTIMRIGELAQRPEVRI